MKTLETLKRSIASAEDLGTVVRTMKAMAAVSIRQYETATESLREYSRTISTGLQMVLQTTLPIDEPLPPGHCTGAIVFGSDQGMCGQFNEQVAQFVIDSLMKEAASPSPLICIGHRVADKLADDHHRIARAYFLPGSVDGITSLVQELLSTVDAWRHEHRLSRILVFHNRRVTASSWQPAMMQLLPLTRESLQRTVGSSEITERTEAAGNVEERTESHGSRSLPTWTMETDVLFSRLVNQFLFVSLFQACAESLAGENASRIAAMQAAERNIQDRLQLLRADYSQQRQTTITEELLDVVTGYEALKDDDR